MPATGLLALLDDIATMSKVAATKTAAISGDDRAVNSKALEGIDPRRELPIVYAVAKGSLKNKAILIPCALALSVAAPWAIMPLLTLGGAYLCFEGVEKILHNEHPEGEKLPEPDDLLALEKKKIKSAIKTDLILSAEIVVVTLGAVAASPLLTQVAVLGAIGVAMTAGIYGLVGGIVKLDDVGLWLAKKEGNSLFRKAQRGIGRALVKGVPHMMKGISVAGTVAMFMVGGGLVLHGIPAAHHMLEAAGQMVSSLPFVQTAVSAAVATLAGVATGLAAMPVVKLGEKIAHKAAPLFKKIKSLGAKIKNAVSHKKSPAKRADDKKAEAKQPAAKKPAAAGAAEKAPDQDNAPALSTAPDVKAAHDAAAQKTDAPAKPAPKPEKPEP
ncbi:MAG: DUF808 family protein, partial [Alphaproteobacteria bacterium]|nr:DUF808 family protein [Alphaproteobacteria bacterium]